MNVFVPHQKDRNIYFDEIIKYSECNYIFGDYTSFDVSYDIVNIQFPEAIFNWIPPSQEQLNDLEEKIILWKKKSKIVLTLNDIVSHYDEGNGYNNLFVLIQKYADGIIHLGNYSLENYRYLFSKNAQHVVIFHPLYESLLTNYEVEDIQNRLSLNFQDKYVVSVIGSIRSIEEVELILKVFKKIPIRNKLLIVPNMFPFWQMPSFMPYRFRKIYKWIVEKRYCFPLNKDQYFFGYKFIEYGCMVDLVQKSSLILIPRVRNLNSGNLFLGLTFDKPMIIPKIGNLTEIADCFDFLALDLKEKNHKAVINNVLSGETVGYFSSAAYLEKKNRFRPSVVANEYDLFFNSIIKD